MNVAKLENKLAKKLPKSVGLKKIQDALELASKFGKKPPIFAERDDRTWRITSDMSLDGGQ